tara:strand:+ start:493 stop:1245 length:753 start_codon:yes stop_codon:yes gene_type:complete
MPDPEWSLMPLTHTTKGIYAEDIIRSREISPTDCPVFNEPLTYFFYGRPAYRISEPGATKLEATCPYCFIFNESLISKAKKIHAFDTGAFANRLFKHVVTDEMNIEDFSLEDDVKRPNRIIAHLFKSKKNYFDGNTSIVAPADEAAEAWEFHARAYVQLIKSTGRNEPDDRISAIEVTVGEKVDLVGNLKAVVVPHTLWGSEKRTPWLLELSDEDIRIETYNFIPGKHPEYYHALLEAAVRALYDEWEML